MDRILIVDDSSTVRLRLRKAVAMLGHESVAVAGGREALEVMHETAFDTVLLDIVKPGRCSQIPRYVGLLACQSCC
jgi:CheY-like chemotaxis protein